MEKGLSASVAAVQGCRQGPPHLPHCTIKGLREAGRQGDSMPGRQAGRSQGHREGRGKCAMMIKQDL